MCQLCKPIYLVISRGNRSGVDEKTRVNTYIQQSFIKLDSLQITRLEVLKTVDLDKHTLSFSKQVKFVSCLLNSTSSSAIYFSFFPAYLFYSPMKSPKGLGDLKQVQT